jgi:hypothetical protein
MIYMTRYLTSILSRKHPSKNTKVIVVLEDKILKLQEQNVSLKKDNDALRQDVDEVMMCINQLASSISSIITYVAPTSIEKKDPVDEILDSFWNTDDDGSGYLN